MYYTHTRTQVEDLSENSLFIFLNEGKFAYILPFPDTVINGIYRVRLIGCLVLLFFFANGFNFVTGNYSFIGGHPDLKLTFSEYQTY